MNIYWIPRHYIHDFCRQNSAAISGRVLDFGCGSTPYKHTFRDCTEYTGIEYDRNLESGSYYNKDDIYFYDGENIPFPDGYFDAIVSFQVIEHIERLNHSLSEIKRVSRCGAKILITGPLLWPEHETPFDYQRYTRWGINKILKDSGFRVVKICPLGTIYDVLGVFTLDYLATHSSKHARKLGNTIAPMVNLITVAFNKLDPWASRLERFSYLDIGILATVEK